MYNIKLDEKGQIGIATNRYYAKQLGLTEEYVGKVLNGKLATKTPVAKGILSIAYHIPLTDEKMEELINKHFAKVS